MSNDLKDSSFNSSRRDLLVGLAAGASGAALAGMGAWPREAQATSNCFGGNGKIPSGVRVFRNASPPATSSEGCTYANWPCTDAATEQAAMASSTWSGNSWLFVWANRGENSHNQKPNNIQTPAPSYMGNTCCVQYCTVAKANAATQSLIRYWLGMANYADPWVDAGGSATDFVSYSDLYANPGSYFTTQITVSGVTYQVMTDVPWTPSFTLADMNSTAPGIALDYEVQDGRSTAETTAFIEALYSDINGQGLQLFLYTNPLNGPNAPYNGLDDTNLPNLCQNYVDFLGLVLWSGNQEGSIPDSYADQIAVLEGVSGTEPVDYSKIVITFELEGTTTSDASFVYSLLTGDPSSNPQAVWFWPDGATIGGACGTQANMQISYALTGGVSSGSCNGL